MAAPNAANIVIAGTGHVYAAPVTTTNLPVNINTALNAAFKELGFTTDEGVVRTDGRTVESVPVWSSFYPPRRFVSDKTGSVGFTLREYNPDTVTFAFGGGAITIVSGPPAYSVYQPPGPEAIDFRSLVVTYADGADDFRFVIPRGMVSSDIESNLTRTGPLDLPITFDITPSTTPGTISATPTSAELATLPWYEISDKGIFTT